MSPTSPSPLPPAETLAFVQRRWEDDVVPALTRYIEIPAKSPAFDPEWAAHGHIDRAVSLIEDWSRGRPIEGLTVETFRLPGRTPVMLLDVPGIGARDRAPLRPLRQAAGDGRLGARPRSLDGRAARRPPVRARRAGRRLRGVLRPHRDRGGAAGRHAARAPAGPDRGQRGERQRRPARLHGVAGRADRRARSRDLSRLGLRQLRPALGHHLAARHHQRRAHRRGADRGRALGRGERHRAVELPHRAPAALAARGRARPARSRGTSTSRCRRPGRPRRARWSS